MTSVKRKKRLRYLLFWESEGELINNHRLKRWLFTVWTAVDRDEMIFELFGEIKTILQRIAVIVPGHPGSCIC